LSFSSSLGERKEINIDLYTWANPTVNNLSFCGAINYELDGSTSYVSVVSSGKIIVYSITGSDVSVVPK
jgi:hypothetical protein